MAVTYRGYTISRGIALGRVVNLSDAAISIPSHPAEDVEAELRAFGRCHEAAVRETEELLAAASVRLGPEEAEILDAQRTFLQDRYAVINPIQAVIAGEKRNMAVAIDQVLSEIAAVFRQSGDEYTMQRAADAEDIRRRLLAHALGISPKAYSRLPENTVIVAKDLTPSDTIRMDLAHVSGIITELGGYYSHVGIITRGYGIPSVSGIADAAARFEDGERIMVDGDAGVVVGGLDSEDLEAFRRKQREHREELEARTAFLTAPTRSADGIRGEICGNTGAVSDAQAVVAAGGDGIGLMRSEFLYMNHNQLPGEEEQYRAYRGVLEAVAGRPVIIRTLDVGGDKDLPCLPVEAEDNPFLGCRAIRLCLANTGLFRTQLRALLRASRFGNLGIMFPMISSLDELRSAKGLLEEARRELEREGVDTAPVKTGIMVEVPAAALLAEHLAREVDFFSIGTNDLIQYTVAAERGNPSVEHLYSPCHPAVLRLIAMTAEAAARHGKLCGMCGESAADELLLPVYWGMGVREFSMAPGEITRIRRRLSRLDTARCRELAEQALQMDTAESVFQLLTQFDTAQAAL